MDWIEKYPKAVKPAYNELLEFLNEDIRNLFLHFDEIVNARFKVHNKYHRFDKFKGWVYGFGRNYNCELFSVSICEDSFSALNMPVKDEKSLNDVFLKIEQKYNDGFEERYTNTCETRRKNQIERTKIRLEREKEQMENLLKKVDKSKFNKFKWYEKVLRNDLLKLYKSEASGLLGENLLDEIGLAFYVRCTQAKKVRALMDTGQLLCFNCNNVITCTSYDDVTMCECGYSYTYREYRRSCNAVNMPGGRAIPVFDEYIDRWEKCNNSTQKMLLIDWLIHECHVTLMSGNSGRSVCVNLIEGTKKQISDLLNGLAYNENK